MSEYIYASEGELLANIDGDISLARERITRCHDCKYIRAWLPNETIDYDGQPIEDIADAFCTFMRIGTEYDYFCAWAEHKNMDKEVMK